MRRPLHRRPSARGFTLLELLVATAVGAIVLLVINATFFGALRLYNSSHDRTDDDLALQRALGIIRKDLAGIMLPGTLTANSVANGGTSNVGLFSGQLQTDTVSANDLDSQGGTRSSPDFYTSSGSIDGWTPFGDVQMVSYYLTPDAAGSETKNLVRVVTRNLLPAQDPTSDNQVILSGVLSVDFLFYDGSDWTDTWDSVTTSTLPSAIKFSLVRAPRGTTQGGIPGSIDLVVPVIVTTTTSAQAAAAAATP
jgi:prepilin-type N-terminal cleavage/methylation domain-containing protein